jgi:hypothetical protein
VRLLPDLSFFFRFSFLGKAAFLGVMLVHGAQDFFPVLEDCLHLTRLAAFYGSHDSLITLQRPENIYGQ